MFHSSTRFLSLAVLLSVAGPGVAQSQAFPTKSTTFKTDGLEFEVGGRTKIPRNADVINLRHCRIVGKGDAVLDVSGYLELKCVTGGNTVLKDVWIELAPDCKELYLSGVVFEGSGGIRPSEAGPSRARVYMEATRFKSGTSFLFETTSGKVTLSGCTTQGPFTVRGRAKDAKGGNKTELQILNLNAYEGITIENVRKSVVISSMIGGKESNFIDCEALNFASNLAKSEIFTFTQTRPKKFGKTKIKSTDFLAKSILFSAPAKKPGQAERVRFDGCYFEDGYTPEGVRARIITDIGKDEKVAVLATFKKLQEKPLGLVKYSPPKD